MDLIHHRDGKAITSHKCNIPECSCLHKQNHMASNEVMLRFTLDKIQLRTRETLKLLWSFTWGFSQCYSYFDCYCAQSWHSCYSSQNSILPMQGAHVSPGLGMDCPWRADSLVTTVHECKSIHGWTTSWKHLSKLVCIKFLSKWWRKKWLTKWKRKKVRTLKFLIRKKFKSNFTLISVGLSLGDSFCIFMILQSLCPTL